MYRDVLVSDTHKIVKKDNYEIGSLHAAWIFTLLALILIDKNQLFKNVVCFNFVALPRWFEVTLNI